MKACMIGLGSIGCRHLRNLKKVSISRNITIQVDALRSSFRELDNEIKDMINTEYTDIDNLPADYDIMFITNPTNLHYSVLEKIIEKTKHVFIEKPIFNHCNYDLNQLQLKSNSIYYIACPIRYTPVIRYVKDIVEKESIYSVRAISSSYLPNWRKNVDYRNVYSAKKSMGGGVSLDLIHEWDYLTYLFGLPEKVMSLNGTYSDLEIDSDDISIYIARYQDKLVEVHLDYFGKTTVRQLELFCKEYVIYVDIQNQKITYKGEQTKTLDFEAEDFYMNEMNYFFDIIVNQAVNTNDIQTAYQTLQIALTN